MKRILNKRERLILYATIGLIAFSVLFNFLIAPLLKKNQDLNNEINITRSRLEKYIRLLSQKESTQSKYDSLPEALRFNQQREGSAVSALLELENLAKSAKILIVDIRPEPAKNIGTHKEIIIDLRTEGDMQGYLKFIYDIEHSLSLLTIKSLKLNTKPNTQLLEGIFSISQLSAAE